MSQFNDSNTGNSSNNRKEMMPTGLSTAGALFALTYSQKTLEPKHDDMVLEMKRLVDKIWNSIEFDSLLCD